MGKIRGSAMTNERKSIPRLLTNNVRAIQEYTGIKRPTTAVRRAMNQFFTHGVLLTDDVKEDLIGKIGGGNAHRVFEVLGKPGIPGWQQEGTLKEHTTPEQRAIILEYVLQNIEDDGQPHYERVRQIIHDRHGITCSSATLCRIYKAWENRQ
jgi:hypothetical protein